MQNLDRILKPYLILSGKFAFKIPVSLQKNHLLDIWHLDKAHRITLFGVQVARNCYRETNQNRRIIRFTLYRFGIAKQVLIQQDVLTSTTTVDVDDFQLKFEILDKTCSGHSLKVSLFSKHLWYKLFAPIFYILFWLTVIEDRLYYHRFEIKAN